MTCEEIRSTFLVEGSRSLSRSLRTSSVRPVALVAIDGASGRPFAGTTSARRGGATQAQRAVVVWTRDILVSLAVAFFVITFLYQPVRVEGTSMLPRLHDQDRIFINKFVYHFEDIGRGDVVVFYYPRDPSKSYIKRVIALPGDRLEVDDGRVSVNGKRIPEPMCRSVFATCDRCLLSCCLRIATT